MQNPGPYPEIGEKSKNHTFLYEEIPKYKPSSEVQNPRPYPDVHKTPDLLPSYTRESGRVCQVLKCKIRDLIRMYNNKPESLTFLYQGIQKCLPRSVAQKSGILSEKNQIALHFYTRESGGICGLISMTLSGYSKNLVPLPSYTRESGCVSQVLKCKIRDLIRTCKPSSKVRNPGHLSGCKKTPDILPSYTKESGRVCQVLKLKIQNLVWM